MNQLRQRDYRLSVADFRAFIENRPDDEKWELIDGEIVLNPAPTNRHQLIVGNLLGELYATRKRANAAWEVIPGIGVRHPQDEHNEPEPDVMIVPGLAAVENWTSATLCVFEVLSPYSIRRDMVHKLAFYRSIPGLSHYIVLAQDRREAVIHSRERSFEPVRLDEGVLDIRPLNVSVALADIYRGVPLG